MKSLFGLNERLVAPIAYLGFVFSGILVYIFEKENRYVRFHALQSTITFGAITVLGFVLNLLWNLIAVLPFVGWIGNMVLSMALWALNIITLAAWIYLMYASWQGKTFKVPVIGDVVWDKVNS